MNLDLMVVPESVALEWAVEVAVAAADADMIAELGKIAVEVAE